ncbi:MAG: Tex-like N-terminal domain-containing protein, partial [Bacteroidota bacterium]
MEQKYFVQIAAQLSITTKQVESIFNMQADGATIPFMARYRKEVTGNLDEVVIGKVVEEIAYLKELHKRKETIIKTIQEQGKLTADLQKRIDDCFLATALEDIYLPYKPKRKTRATQATEKGLEPLAALLFAQTSFDVDREASKFLNDEVKDVKEALQGARDIIAEWISENEMARAALRKIFAQSATLSSKIVTTKKDEADAQKYRDYFEFSGSLAQSPSHRILAIRRGEKDGFLMMDISIDRTTAIETLENMFVKAANLAATEVKKAIEDCYNRLLKFSVENEFRLQSKSKADEEAIFVFTENLRQLLLASPLGAKRVLALDPGFRS